MSTQQDRWPRGSGTGDGRHVERIPDVHFERRYQREDDPWQLERPWYERRKRGLTLGCLGRDRYRRAFEPGCGPGLLTASLAERCDALVAIDPAATAVATTRRRVAGASHVTVDRGAVPDDWPLGRFDLIVLSEVGYYLSPRTLRTVIDRIRDALVDGGELVAVHFRPPSDEHLLDGDRVHDTVAAAVGLRRVVRHVEQRFLLDVFRRASGEAPPCVDPTAR